MFNKDKKEKEDSIFHLSCVRQSCMCVCVVHCQFAMLKKPSLLKLYWICSKCLYDDYVLRLCLRLCSTMYSLGFIGWTPYLDWRDIEIGTSTTSFGLRAIRSVATAEFSGTTICSSCDNQNVRVKKAICTWFLELGVMTVKQQQWLIIAKLYDRIAKLWQDENVVRSFGGIFVMVFGDCTEI